ncbi:MAG: MBL fold metallo-hydrolase [Clostridia bacterium]|nr:MBL fold metallo-hydrolase [Clostridia bacterium]
MKITVLAENTSGLDDIGTEHGLSLYIETQKHKILFDMGQSVLFEQNAQKLGKDIKSVDIAVLSHGHYDHGGGLQRFLELNLTAPVYASAYAFEKYYSGQDRYIGLDRKILQLNAKRLVFIDDCVRIDDELEIISCNGRKRPFANHSSQNMVTERDGEFTEDEFLHEQYLVVKEGGKSVVFSACSHKGILNIASWFDASAIVGGFHFSKIDDEAFLTNAANVLNKSNAKFFTCHCTGEKQYNYMKKIMNDRIEYISCGQQINIQEEK